MGGDGECAAGRERTSGFRQDYTCEVGQHCTLACVATLTMPKPTNRGEWLHSTQHARTVKKQLAECGVECVLVQDEKDTKPKVGEFLLKHLAVAVGGQ